jgi:hypothetical protein
MAAPPIKQSGTTEQGALREFTDMHKHVDIAARSCWPMLAALWAVMATTGPALAQIEEDGFRTRRPALPEGYEPRTLRTGSLVIRPELDLLGYYDSNIYADESGETDDFVLTAVPRLSAAIENEKLQWTAEGYTALHRYIDNSSENSTTFGAMSRVVAMPTEQFRLGGGVSFARVAEDRGAPEGRTDPGIGPRIYNDLGGELFAGVRGSRLGVQLRGEVEKLDYRSAADNERDRTTYVGSVRGLYQMSALFSFFAQGDVRRREYRLSSAITGIDRDSTTFGGVLGVQIDPGGKVQGEAYAGVYRFDADDPLISKHTGFQLGAGLDYALTPRTTITLTAFRGDAATVQPGANGRTDTRVRLGFKQEVRHNIRIASGLEWRKVEYRGLVDQDQDKWAADVEVEYLLNRYMAVAAIGRYNGRQSEVQGQDYNRFQAGLALRLRY